jgi:hypothetical protein
VPFKGLTDTESNPDASGNPATMYRTHGSQPDAYFVPGIAARTSTWKSARDAGEAPTGQAGPGAA